MERPESTRGEAGMASAAPVQLLTRAEVAAAFRVSGKTVSVWAKDGRLGSTRTPGGHFAAEVEALLHRLTESGDAS